MIAALAFIERVTRPRTLSLTGWLALALIVLLILTAGSCAWMSHQDAAERQKATEAQTTIADGRTAAAGDASGIRDRADARSDQITNAVNQGASDVRKAPDRTSANRAARLGVCRLNPDAGADCRLLLADPARMD